MDLGAWLRGLGLGRYEQAFREHDIDAGLLTRLTAEDLKEIGVASVGHRRRLLDAIAALRGAEDAAGSASARPAAASSQAERRQLTVMFVDLVGSTALARRLDLEGLRALIAAYHAAVAATVARHSGFVASYMGDGVLAYFGWPQAHEDDAERAIRAGLELTTAGRALASPPDTALRIRVGIATGLVVVGDLIGGGAAREPAVVGETPNLAARLQAIAEPDAVVIAAGTRRLVGDLFACADLGAVEAKGFAEPVPAYRVLRAGMVESRFEALHAAVTPLVGREAEVGLLLRGWRRASAGEGRVVLLSGEPGVASRGCSRRWRSGRRRAAPPPALLLLAAPPGQRLAPGDRAAQARGRVGTRRSAGRKAREAGGAAGQGGSTHRGHCTPGRAAVAADRRPACLVAARSPAQAGADFAALLRRLDGLARRAPVLMVFEDVHWIDPSSRALLDLLVERAARLPVLLLVTFRPEFEPPWTGRPHVALLMLNRLGRQEGTALVRQVAGGNGLSEGIVAEIVERTDGVPLFIEELTKAVIEAGAGEAVGTLAAASPAVPATLHASLMARLDRLGSAAREAAQIGAAIGREFSFALLAAVAGRDEAGLAAALDQLAAAGLVFRHGAGPQAGYLFKHALVRDAAYGTLLRERRRQLHAGIARVLEERFSELAETAPELIAHHLSEAAEAVSAVGWWLKAGRRSAARSADREAVGQLRRGLEVLTALPPGADRDRLELGFQLAIGTPLIALSGWGGAPVAAAYERAAALCERLGDDEDLVPALFGLASNRVVRGETRTAQRLAERCRSLAQRSGRPADRLLAHRAMGAALMQRGALRDARAEFERIGALYDPERDRSLAARCVTDPRASGLSFLALVLWMMGYPEQAQRTAQEASRCAAELGHANTTGHVLCHAGAELDQFLRDAPAARAHAEAALALAAEHHMPMWRGYGTVFCGWAVAEGGDAEEGAVLVRRGIGELDTLGTVFHRPHHLAILAGIHGRRGDSAAGLRVLEEAKAEVLRTGIGFCEAELHRIEGELRALAGAPEAEVEACFAAALATARRQGARSFELRAAVSLARLRRDRGRYGEARAVLEPVYGWFTQGRTTPDLKDAEALLAGLG